MVNPSGTFASSQAANFFDSGAYFDTISVATRFSIAVPSMVV